METFPMTTVRKLMTTGAVAAIIGAGALAVTTTAADARTVCNRFGDCWQESVRYHYPAALGVRFYNDDWRWRHHGGYHWRDRHDGRGYWRNGVWITF
jgi:hypothetical protein